jgi:RecA-family ATPase
MEKGDPSSDTEQTPEEPIVETVSAVKPKRKMNLTDEQRAVRAERMRVVALARIEKSRAVNAEVADKVKAIHKEAVQKGKKLRMKKAFEIQHPELDSDSDSSDDEIFTSSKKKRKSKANQPIIVIKNYHHDKKKEYDASENVAKLQEMYKSCSEPVIEPVRRTIGYFV